MKYLFHALSALLFTGLHAAANDKPVPVKDLPPAVVAAVQEYFPGAKILSAEVDDDDDRIELELQIEHRGVRLELEMRPDGRIREIDLDRPYRGLASLLGREASLEPVPVTRLPEAARAALADFFGPAEIRSAAEGVNDEEKFYRVRLRHLALPLRVDLTATGQILDIDTEK